MNGHYKNLNPEDGKVKEINEGSDLNRRYILDDMHVMTQSKERKGERENTSVGSGCGTCYSGRACQGNRCRRTCNKRFEDPPLLFQFYKPNFSLK